MGPYMGPYMEDHTWATKASLTSKKHRIWFGRPPPTIPQCSNKCSTKRCVRFPRSNRFGRLAQNSRSIQRRRRPTRIATTPNNWTPCPLWVFSWLLCNFDQWNQTWFQVRRGFLLRRRTWTISSRCRVVRRGEWRSRTAGEDMDTLKRCNNIETTLKHHWNIKNTVSTESSWSKSNIQ